MKISTLKTGNIAPDLRKSSIILFLVYVFFNLLGFSMGIIFPAPFPAYVHIVDLSLILIVILSLGLFFSKKTNLQQTSLIVSFIILVNLLVSDIYVIFNEVAGWQYIVFRDAFVFSISLIVTGYICGYKIIIAQSIVYELMLIVSIISFNKKELPLDIFFSLMMFVFGSSFTIVIYKQNLVKTMNQKLFLENEVNRRDKKILKKEIELTKNKSEHLKEILQQKDRELTSYALLIARNNERNKLIEKKVQKLLGQKEEKLIKEIQSELSKEGDPKLWERFQRRFEEVHPDFYKRVALKAPDISPADKRLATLIRLGLTSKEIASLIYNTPASVDVSRSRLRKKLQINRSENIESFLNNL